TCPAPSPLGGIPHAQALAGSHHRLMPGPPSCITPEVFLPSLLALDCARKGHKLATQYQTAVFYPMKSASKKRAPTIVNLTVKRRCLTEREVERLMDCARKYGRYGHRDATMILVAYRHGLRASEVCDLQWQQIELSEG